MWLVVGALSILGIAAFLIAALTTGNIGLAILSGLGLLYAVWSTYDTFVLKACWTLYVKVVE